MPYAPESRDVWRLTDQVLEKGKCHTGETTIKCSIRDQRECCVGSDLGSGVWFGGLSHGSLSSSVRLDRNGLRLTPCHFNIIVMLRS